MMNPLNKRGSITLAIAIAISGSSLVPHAASARSKEPLLIPVSADEPLYIAPKKHHVAKAKPKAEVKAPVAAENFAPPAAPTEVVETPAVAAAPAPSAPSQANVNYQQRHLQALDRALAGDTKSALTILNSLTSVQMPPEERDRVYLSIGRTHYQAGNDALAIEAYKQVRKGSSSWLESLEERAWANLRMGQPQEALANLKTVLTPLFQDRILSEPYFLAALAQLRVCDYQAVFKTLDLFKNRFRTKVKSWEVAKDMDPVANLRLKETSDTIQKLNLVEAEAIQRLYIDENGRRGTGSAPKIATVKDQLKFPTDNDMDSKEVWLDEVEDYRVSTKGCMQPLAGTQTKKESAL